MIWSCNVEEQYRGVGGVLLRNLDRDRKGAVGKGWMRGVLVGIMLSIRRRVWNDMAIEH